MGSWQWLASRNSADPCSNVSQSVEDACLGWFDVVGMDIERGPIADGAILAKRHGEDAQLRMCAENRLTNIGTPSGLIQCDHNEIGQSLIHAIWNFRLLRHFSDDFDAGLIRQRLKNQFPHEPRSVSHEDPNCLVHGLLLLCESREYPCPCDKGK